MKSRDETLAIIHCAQRIDAALKSKVQMQIGDLGDMFLQQRQRKIVAGAYGKQLMTLITGIGKNTRQVGAQRLDVRLHAGSCATFSPKQSFRELRRARPLSLRPNYQRFSESLFPFPEGAPHVAV